jgi:hypothetical protein
LGSTAQKTFATDLDSAVEVLASGRRKCKQQPGCGRCGGTVGAAYGLIVSKTLTGRL